jgi:hypothetical protein
MANLKLKTQFNDLVDASVVENQIEDLTSSLDDYALKQQEAFISPTLINTWVNAVGEQPVEYMKDNFGFVHVRGVASSGGIPNAIFVLPVGYRPAIAQLFVFLSNGAFSYGYVQTNGDVVIVAGSNVYVSLNSITFKV